MAQFMAGRYPALTIWKPSLGKFCPVGPIWPNLWGGSLSGLISFLRGMGAGRLAAMLAVTMALLGFIGFVILRVTAPQMITLYTDLSYDDASGVMKELDRQGIPYELRNDGSIIMVPKDKVTRLRMKLAENGLPKGGGVGNEINDTTNTLNTTNKLQKVKTKR